MSVSKGLSEGDLKDTVLKKISIDEYEPKTGESKDVVVVGFHVNENTPGQDLYNFISSSIFEIRDAEVSPNPNPENYYMVFVEMDRNDDVLENIRSLVKDVENVTGKLPWEASTHISEQSYPLHSEELAKYVITDPENYLTKEEWEQQVADETSESVEELQEASQVWVLQKDNGDMVAKFASESEAQKYLDMLSVSGAKSKLKVVGPMPDPQQAKAEKDKFTHVGHSDEKTPDMYFENNCGCGNNPCETIEFLKNTNLLDVKINNNVLEMQDRNHTATLQFVKFGEAKEVMAEIGITETALSPVDNTLRMFNSMLGEMKAVKIDEYVVIFNPASNNVLVTKEC